MVRYVQIKLFKIKHLTLLLFCLSLGNVFSQYYTKAQLTTINNTRSAFEGDLYLDTVNDDYYIGLTHGILAKIGDTLDERLDTVFVENDSLLVIVEGGDTSKTDIEAVFNTNSHWELNANGSGLESKYGSNNANGVNSIVAGISNAADGLESTISGGRQNGAPGDRSVVAGGFRNTSSGDFSAISGGVRNEAPSYGEWVGGLFSTVYAPVSTSAFNANDKLFVVGNGTSSASRSNALTLLKDGRLGLGVDGNAAQTATLHINPQTAIDPLRVEQLNAANPNDTVFLVTDPTNGTVKYLDFDNFRSPTNQLFFAAEYAGSVFDTINGVAGNHFGYMTANNTGTPNFMNYYEWYSDETSAQDYDVVLRFRVPDDFTSWGVSTIANQSQTNGNVSIQVRNITAGGNITPLTNVSNAAWTNTNLNMGTLVTNPGDIIVMIITLASDNGDYSRVGDIVLNYNL